MVMQVGEKGRILGSGVLHVKCGVGVWVSNLNQARRSESQSSRIAVEGRVIERQAREM